MDRISDLLTRGVANIIPGKSELEKLLHSGKKLNIYNGIDPTNVHVHLGNAFPLRKLKVLVDLGHHVTLNDFISRELNKPHLAEGRSVSLPEVLYPVMQGYDSYFMDTDLQIGGTDQTFNMQAGRTLQKNLRGKESFVMSLAFLTGTDGRKMSKTWGNAIWLDDPPEEMYG